MVLAMIVPLTHMSLYPSIAILFSDTTLVLVYATKNDPCGSIFLFHLHLWFKSLTSPRRS